MAGEKIMPGSNNLDQIFKDILAVMSLKERTAVAFLDDGKVLYIQYAFDASNCSQLGKDD